MKRLKFRFLQEFWDASHVYDYKITLNLDATLGVKAGISNPTITEWGTPEEIDVPVEK